jgi:hypothetical protein
LGCSGELDRGSERRREDVWEGCGDGASSTVRSEPPFIGRRGQARGWPEVGVRQRASSNAGCGGFGSVLARSADGFRYCRRALACSRRLASCREAEGKERGPVVSPPAFFRVSWPGPGRVRGGRQLDSLGEAGALFGGQGLVLGLPILYCKYLPAMCVSKCSKEIQI